MRPLKLSPADRARYLAEMRKIRFTAQGLLHRIPASDPVSLAVTVHGDFVAERSNWCW